MNTDNFEDRIKSAFERHRPETDNDAIWENIEPRLKKKKKRRFIIFFWLLGLGLLLLLFRNPGGWERFAPSDAFSATGKSATESPAENTAQVEKAASLPTEKSNPTAPAEAAGTDVTGTLRGKYKIVPPVAAKVKPLENSASAEVSAASENTAPIQTASAGIDAQIRSVEAMPEPVSVPAPNTPFLEATNSNSTPDVSAPINAERVQKDKKTIEKGEKQENVDEKAGKDAKKPAKAKSKKRRSKWEHNIGIQAGPALAIRLLSDDGGVSAPAGLLEGRKETESSLESFTAGMFYSATTRKGLVLKTGLEYRQANEKFHLEYNTVETEVVNGVVSVTVDNAGNTIGQSIGPKTVTTTTEYSNTAYNHYRFVNLPVGIGYRKSGKKSRWELSGGVDFNLLFRAEGTIFNSEIVPTLFEYGTTSYDNIFRNSTGMGLWGAYGYDWRLTDQLRWQLSANFQIPLRPVSSPDYELVQRYINVGLQVGVVYQVVKWKKGK